MVGGVAAVVFSVRQPEVSDRWRVYRGCIPCAARQGILFGTVCVRDASCRQCRAGIEGMIGMAQVIARQAELVQRLLRPFFDPGHVVELPGYFRLSLTAPDEVAERSLPIFARAIEQARSIVRK